MEFSLGALSIGLLALALAFLVRLLCTLLYCFCSCLSFLWTCVSVLVGLVYLTVYGVYIVGNFLWGCLYHLAATLLAFANQRALGLIIRAMARASLALSERLESAVGDRICGGDPGRLVVAVAASLASAGAFMFTAASLASMLCGSRQYYARSAAPPPLLPQCVGKSVGEKEPCLLTFFYCVHAVLLP